MPSGVHVIAKRMHDWLSGGWHLISVQSLKVRVNIPIVNRRDASALGQQRGDV